MLSIGFVAGCESTYYSAMEKIGFEKRDILVDRVASARDAQEEAQLEFASALEQLSMMLSFDGGELADKYALLDDEYQSAASSAARVRDRIAAIEDVSEDLFEEWRGELDQYNNERLRRDSERKLRDTERRAQKLTASMRRAEARMAPVLSALRDNVLYLKHNLNASAIGALQGELGNIEQDVDQLIKEMNTAIAESNAFIDSMQN